MGAIITANINLDKLDKSKVYKGEKGTYYSVTISVNDESKYGNNVSVFTTQTKEERDAKAEKSYLANGKVVWTDGNIVVAEADPAQLQKKPAPVSAGEDFDLF